MAAETSMLIRLIDLLEGERVALQFYCLDDVADEELSSGDQHQCAQQCLHYLHVRGRIHVETVSIASLRLHDESRQNAELFRG